jgi:enterochelin esterase-like enzyme
MIEPTKNTTHALILGLLALALATIVCPLVAMEIEENENLDSPRLAALAKELAPDHSAALDKFWEEMKGHAPIVEPIADDPHTSWVTFVWRGDGNVRKVVLLGGPPTAEYGSPMRRLRDTDLWYRTDRISNDARFVYRFLLDVPDRLGEDPELQARYWKEHPPRPDPLNPNRAFGGQGSVLELSEAAPQPWLQRIPGLPSKVSNLMGKFLPSPVNEHTLKSEILKQDRQYGIYLPPDYDAQGPECGLLVLFDGNGCRQMVNNPFPVDVMLDNLIREKKIPPVVVVFVFQTEQRDKELSCSKPFADFVAKELIPHVRTKYKVSAEPARTIIGGMSLGGLMSSYCAYRHPEVFGNVLSMSGSYPWFPGAFEGKAPRDAEPGWLTRQMVASPKLDVHYYLAAGRFENFFPFSLLGENRRFRDVLLAKGYPVQYSEFTGGHDPVCWCGPFVEGMIALSNDRGADK